MGVDPLELAQLKRAAGLRVSVVIPAYDEQATIGAIVARLQAELVQAAQLVDELVVIDSRSRDDTAQLACAAGAQVFSVDEILPELPARRGKGEAIWRSLFVATGDLVAFLDGDLLEWGPHFVTEVVAPLVLQPQVQLVKGYYHRLVSAGVDHDRAGRSHEGGRVTELVARPLLARHRPALGDVVQPLAGEWAVRRDVLADCSVPVGYGVDLAALIDVHDRYGRAAVAQADLGSRAHSHQPLRDLGAMALQLMAVVERRTTGPAAAPPEQVLLQQFDSADTAEAGVRWVDVQERAPAAQQSAYRPARARAASAGPGGGER